MSRFLPPAGLARACFWGVLSAVLASGCIDSIVVDVESAAASVRDASRPGDEEDGDAAGPVAEADASAEPADAGKPMPPPVIDAGQEPTPRPDAGHDAGRDAGPPAAQDAGSRPDAGCTGARCDAGSGSVPGPCASCGGVAVLVQPAGSDAVCDNGSPTVCWSNPVGECTMQCPNTGSCSKDDPGACGPGRYCYFAKSDCGASSAGFCATAPKECASLSVPVCGCDGKVHTNTCVAAMAGTAVYTGLATDHCN